MHAAFAARTAAAIPLELVTSAGVGPWTKTQDKKVKVLVDATAFRGDTGKVLVIPNAEGAIEKVVAGIGDGTDGFALASLPGTLPPGDYELVSVPEGLSAETLALGWADGAYRFTRYKTSKEKPRRLVMPKGADAD